MIDRHRFVPSDATRCSILRAPASFAPIWAERSPSRSVGVRVAAMKGSTKSAIHTPLRTAGIGETTYPSCSTRVAWAGIDPGASPPTSA